MNLELLGHARGGVGIGLHFRIEVPVLIRMETLEVCKVIVRRDNNVGFGSLRGAHVLLLLGRII